jgi:hypothetical protein
MSKTAQRKTPDRPAFGNSKFINFSLTDDQKKALKALLYTAENFIEDLDRIANSGYKVSISWDDYGSCFACFWTQKDPKHENAGFVLTARGSTSLKAFKQAMYLHFQIFDGSWADYYERPAAKDLDD